MSSSIKRGDLIELKSLKEPTKAMKDVGVALAILLGKNEEEMLKLKTNNLYSSILSWKNVQNIDLTKITSKQTDLAMKYLNLYDLATISKSSAALSGLYVSVVTVVNETLKLISIKTVE